MAAAAASDGNHSPATLATFAVRPRIRMYSIVEGCLDTGPYIGLCWLLQHLSLVHKSKLQYEYRLQCPRITVVSS